jgi:hypothetical protein
LRLSTPSSSGIAIRSSASACQRGVTPFRSLPTASAVGPVYRAAQYGVVAAGSATTIRMPRLRSQRTASSVVASASGTRNTAPTEPWTVSG